MLHSERKSLYRFMLIYLISTLLMFGIAATIFYQFEHFKTKEYARQTLKQDTDRLLPFVRKGAEETLRESRGLKFAVYTGKKEYLFGNYKPDVNTWTSGFEMHGDSLRHIRVIPPPHRMRTAFLVVEKSIDQTMMHELRMILFYVAICMFIMLLTLGYFLGRLFIAPMREALEKINLFVQDTTHELNTPVSTILTNIEMIELLQKCPHSEEMERIKIASGTLSRIYDDLSYLKLNETYERQIESVDLSRMLEERLTYFTSMMRAKQIKLTTEIKAGIIREMDRTDAMRLFDNLLSNAIKYNHVGGSITVQLDEKVFVLEDTGRGMDMGTQKKVFERFSRGDKSEGGFGIGLDIVSQICIYYGYRISLTSKEGEGTHISLKF